MKNTQKYIAYFTIEADTPFAIGSGEQGVTVDRLIARDALGLPYIPGSSLAGVLRHELDPTNTSMEIKHLFGFQEKENKGEGSRLVISSAHLIGADGVTVVEGLQDIDFESGYYACFRKLPERDHVRINEKGAVDGSGKFDEELVHKGTRFVFSIELSGGEREPHWDILLQAIHQPFFRIGGGTRKGFGKFKIISCKTRIFNLTIKQDLQDYLDLPSSLNVDVNNWNDYANDYSTLNNWTIYRLTLQPENFFLFASGYGDEEVDTNPKTERYFNWAQGRPVLSEKEWLLIPATSIKGALSHRTAFYYNMLVKNYVYGIQNEINMLPSINVERFKNTLLPPIDLAVLPESSQDTGWEELKSALESWDFERTIEESGEWKNYLEELDKYRANYSEPVKSVGENNPAVQALFGYALDNEKEGARGNVIISDLYLDPDLKETKIFSHVAIDRFTGGARDGMLFQQRVASSNAFVLDIYVKKAVLTDNVKIAFEEALKDLYEGNLQLGGSAAKGHGIFKGSLQIINN